MAIDPKVFEESKDLDPAPLDCEDRAAVEGALVAWLGTWKNVSFIDGEVIGYAGQMVGRSRHDAIDVALQQRLGADAEAQTIAASFLFTYWAWKPVSNTFDLEAFVRALDTFASQQPAYATTALALYSAATNKASGLDEATRRRLRERLLETRHEMRSKGLYPGVLVYLDKLVKPPFANPR